MYNMARKIKPLKTHKAASTIKRNLKELRTLIDTDPDPVVRRIAYSMETAIRWATEETVGWDEMVDEAIEEATILKNELGV